MVFSSEIVSEEHFLFPISKKKYRVMREGFVEKALG
jgi:hypothetical protein